MARKKKLTPVDEPKPGSSHDRLRTVLGVIVLLIAAVVIRDIYLLQYRSALPYYNTPPLDSEYYDQWAQRVASGHGYGPMPFYMAPLYPYFLALIYKLAGHSFPIAYSVQEALGILNLLLVYFLGRRLFGHVPGLIAMALLTLYAPLVYLESKLLTETLGITLSLISLLLLVRALERPNAVRYLAAGVVLGIGALCRPPSLMFIALVLGWLLLRRKSLQENGFRPVYALVLLIGVALAIMPVTVRNYVVGKGFALIGTNTGIVFAQANNPYANGISMPMPGFTTAIITQQDEEMRLAAKALGHPVTPFESSAYWLDYGLKFIRENPGQFALLTGKKLIWSLHNREAGCSYNVNFEREFVPILHLLIVPFAALSGFAMYGFARGRRTRFGPETELLGLQILSVFLGLIIFSVSSRYRVPMIPALAIFAGFGILQVVEHLRNREFARTAVAAIWIAPMFLVSLVPYPIPPIMPSEPGNLGVAYMAAGDMNNAVKFLEKAVEMNPDSSLAHLNMGLALSRLGKPDEAIEHYREGLRIAPDDERINLELGEELMRKGLLDDSMRCFVRIIAINPANADAHLFLGAALSGQEKMREAIGEFRKTIELRPDMAVAYYDLALCLDSVGEHREAWKQARLAEQHGWTLPSWFIKRLSKEMPDPGR